MSEGASAAEELQLELDLRQPRRQLVQAQLRLRPQHTALRLRLPAWTPGSYLIRDYVRTLEGLEVRQGGAPLPLRRCGVADWSLRLQSLEPVEIHWRILATELSVRTCHLSGDHGFLALAGVVLQVEGARWRPHRLMLRLPEGWQPFVPLPGQEDGTWLAPDFDTLVDTPLELGPHRCHSFEVAGRPHRWVSWGGDPVADDPAWLADVEQVCLACCRLMGEEHPPAADYLFVLHLLEQGYNGLEHDSSCVLQFGRRALRRPEGRRKLLQLVAHEYLHQWNVRRLRPAELTPIDYDRPTIVSSLWFAEGVTSYLDLLLPVAAGLVEEEVLLEDLSTDLSRYRFTAGRHVQSLQASAEEAWVKLYRQDAHSHDSQISYYLKGAVLTLVLDLHLRRHGSWIGAVLRQLWQSHGRHRRGYRPSDLIAAFADHAPDLSTLVPMWLASTDDPPIDSYLEDVGLRLVPETGSHPFAGWQPEAQGTAGLVLRRVDRDGAAQRSGLQVGDELLAIDGQRVRSDEDLGPLLGPPGQPRPVAVLFCRDGQVRQATLQADPPVVVRWRLESLPQPAAECLERRRRWRGLQP
ncbi:MAG: PDZ domain-containing protein [Synechococcaceae cyanobacterium]|nr:PDZ domain-containing protein [Synechococcaceae cyanobacterium]